MSRAAVVCMVLSALVLNVLDQTLAGHPPASW